MALNVNLLNPIRKRDNLIPYTKARMKTVHLRHLVFKKQKQLGKRLNLTLNVTVSNPIQKPCNHLQKLI